MQTVLKGAGSLQQLSVKIFLKARARQWEAEIVWRHLVEASLFGVDSYEIIHIPLYVGWLRRGLIKSGQELSLDPIDGAIYHYNGQWGFRQVIAERVLERMIHAMSERLITLTLITNCNHVGRLGNYAARAAERDLISLIFVNSQEPGHNVVPFGAIDPRIAPNPIAWGFPARRCPIVADQAMSTTTQGKVFHYRDQNRPVPEGWQIDSDDEPTTGPEVHFRDPPGSILPVGGPLDYKGFSFLLLAEFMTGLLAGHQMSEDRSYSESFMTMVLINRGHILVTSAYPESIADAPAYRTSARMRHPGEEVLLSNEREFGIRKKRINAGIPVPEDMWKRIVQTAASLRLGVDEEC